MYRRYITQNKDDMHEAILIIDEINMPLNGGLLEFLAKDFGFLYQGENFVSYQDNDCFISFLEGAYLHDFYNESEIDEIIAYIQTPKFYFVEFNNFTKLQNIIYNIGKKHLIMVDDDKGNIFSKEQFLSLPHWR